MTAGKAQTPHESDDDKQQDIRDEVQIHEPEDNGSHLPHPQNEDNDRPQVGRQKAVAAISNVHPPDMLAKLICALKKSNLRVIEDVRSHYAVSAGQQPDGILSDELRGLVQNGLQLQSQDQSTKYIPLRPGMTFQGSYR